MIQIESVHIEEIRGLRNLTLEMNRGNLVVWGPNGSGKSGVVDAIQFALTGDIGRLKGFGTGDLNLAEHGPHVSAKEFPDASFVRVNAFIPSLNSSATITRWIRKPKQPEITPNEPRVVAVFSEVARHPEFILARREVIKFILTEATQRSRDVQTLLKLDEIDQTRTAFKTAENRLQGAHRSAASQVESEGDSLKRHLDIPALRTEDVLAAVNPRRRLLGLPEFQVLTKESSLSEGVAGVDSNVTYVQPKESALRDIQALVTAVATPRDSGAAKALDAALRGITRLESDVRLLTTIKRDPLFSLGLDLIDGPYCPLCDTAWDVEALQVHLREKLAQAEEARVFRNDFIQAGATLVAEISRICGLLEVASKLPEASPAHVGRFNAWSKELHSFSRRLTSHEGILGAKSRLEAGWLAAPDSLMAEVALIQDGVAVRPQKSVAGEAREFLIVAQERLARWRGARRDLERRRLGAEAGATAYSTYCDVAETVLNGLYASVSAEFETFYRFINQDDEAEFKAKFQPNDGRLGLLVDFYGKGLFPPAAYHSEGHQDGMGVCLYLALMNRVLGKDFALAVLDDVVMSVDAQHRRQFCKLLKTRFAGTQFIITTHDQVWTRQMRSEGLVRGKNSIAFHSWNVATGPVLGEIADVWDQIGSDLAKNDVTAAAGRLRRHLEFVAADLADELGAQPHFHLDGAYDMGELLHAVIGRQRDLLKMARKAAKSWKDEAAETKVAELEKARTEILSAYGGEEWVLNKAIHYNEWADLSTGDFRPVVDVFRQLLGQFRCSKPACDSWLALSPRKDPADLRCECGNFRLNLKEK